MANITWTGNAGDGNYDNPANWSPQQVPGPSDNVTIAPAAVSTISINEADAVQTLKTSNKVSLVINNGDSLTIGNSNTPTSTLNNAGLIEINSSYNNTELVVGSPTLTVSGGGTILLNNYGNDIITGNAATDVLNNTNNLIEGGGALGNGMLTLVNGAAGVIDANDGTQLFLNTGTVSVANAGTLEATAAGAGLVIDSSVTNTGTGSILAASATVTLTNGMTVSSGTLASSGGAAIDVSGSATLSSLTNTGQVAVVNGSALTLLGTITNTGTISLGSTYNNTDLLIGPSTAPGTVTLTGGGTVAMGDYPSNILQATAAGDTLVNLNNTITGAGALGNGTLTLVNDGTISATGGNVLYLNAATTNAGLIESLGAGGLDIQSTVSGSTLGTILAASSNATLSGATIQGGTLASAGTYAIQVSGGATLDGTVNTVVNKGTLAVLNSNSVTLLGTISNSGMIALGSSYNNTNLLIGGASPGTVTLTGSGTIAMGNYPANQIYGAAAGDTLLNVNNTISGAGQLGAGSLTLINDATIMATGSYGLVLDAATTNTGLIEALSTGVLTIEETVANGTKGEILANGGIVSLSGVTISGGTLASVSGAEIQVANSATLDGTTNTVINSGTIALLNGTNLTLLGTITNSGTISLQSSYNYTELLVGPGGSKAGTVTLTGKGTVFLGDYSANILQGSIAGDALVNLNDTITGAGQLGDGTLSLTNDAIISAVSASGTNALVLNALTTNNGTMESLATGDLVIVSTVNNGTKGQILSAGGLVDLSGGADIQGGKIGGASIEVTGGVTLDGTAHAVTNAGTIAIANGQALTLLGSIVNTGTIGINSTYNYTNLVIGSPTVTLTGGGAIMLGDYPAANLIYGSAGTDVLDNVNNTIEGAGLFGDGQLTFINGAAGIVNANASNSLTITSNGSTITNAGLIEATGTGGLIVSATIDSSSGGTILAGSGSDVYLSSGSLAGGLLSGAGTFVVSSNGTLDGSAHTLTNAGNVEVNNGQQLYLLGSIVNTGTIGLNSTYNNTDLVIDSATVKLTGGGTIALGDYPANRIYGASGAYVLDNVNNTIEGAGQLGAGQLTFTNEAAGIVDATGSNALTITSNGSTITNAGLIEATGAGGLIVSATIDSSSGGTILSGAGSDVYLSGGSFAGGLLSGAGTFVVSSNGTLDGSAHTLTNAGNVEVNNGEQLYLLGAIDNTGTIGLNSTYNNTDLVIDSPTVTLTGSGTIALGDYSANRIYGASAINVLDNVNSTIEGAGQLGAGQLTLLNAGTIAATGGNALYVNLGSTGMNLAGGLMVAEGAGGLIFQNGTYSNQGTIQADNGSAVTFQNDAVLTNDNATGTLSGGTYAALDTGNDATLSITGMAVNTLAATIDLSGAGASILFGGQTIQQSLSTIAKTGTLEVLNDANYTVSSYTGTLTDNGTIDLGGGTLTATKLIIANGAFLNGDGTIDSDVVNNGLITIENGQLIFNGHMSGSGSITTGAGGLVVLQHGGSLNQAIGGTGTLEVKNGAYTLSNGSVTIANLDVDANASVTGSGTITSNTSDVGTITASGGTLTLKGAVSGGGTLAAAASSLLVEAGGGNFSGTFAGPGEILIAQSLKLGAGAKLDAANFVEQANLSLVAGLSLTNLAGNAYTIMASSRDTGRHRASIEVRGGHGASFANAGMLNVETNTAFKLAFSNTGQVAIAGGTATIGGAISGGGTYAIAADGIMDVAGGGDFAADLTGAGTLEFTNATTLATGTSLSVAAVIDTSTLTLDAGETLNNLAGNSFTLTDAAQEPRHRASIEVKGGSGSVFANAGMLLANAAADSVAVNFTNTGAVSASAGKLSFLASAANNGNITASAATISFAQAVSGTGSLDIAAAGTLSLLAGSGSGQMVDFQAGSGLLDLTNSLDFLGNIAGFASGDQIDLVKTQETGYSFANGILTVENGSTVVASLQFSGSYSQTDFSVRNFHGDVIITHH